ncbi:MAG TPA: tRNA (adenosine(37)-N6)-threonylcarbamoyltransferase complex ATPase subunit type 1 TsaE [Blastocatellia bacterium]|nr:tRNA (adenosine(37)-N6)-threonylcarbamoyltransferase complex ATPase subunit type 1 TsaE [Blastocatellia bacterium]
MSDQDRVETAASNDQLNGTAEAALAALQSIILSPAGTSVSEYSVVTHSAEETFNLAKAIAKFMSSHAAASSVVLLSGELGAGKTVFTKGIAAGLGIEPVDVTSPTFTLINSHAGKMTLYHADLYRLDRVCSIDLGLDELFEQPGSLTVIEWAERLDDPPPGAIAIGLEYLDYHDRRITAGRV